MRAVQICMLARAARYRNFGTFFNRGGHESIKSNRSMHSPDRLAIDYLCIAPIDYLWLVLIIARVPVLPYCSTYIPVPVLVDRYLGVEFSEN